MKRSLRLRFLVIAVLLPAVLLLSACGRRSETDGVPEAVSLTPETDTVRLAYSIELSSNGHILNAIAEQQGYLEAEGIRVEYVYAENDAETFQALENGAIDILSNSGTNLPLQRIGEGQDLTIFGGYMLTGCMPVIARVETEWNGIEDLIGKTVAFEPNLYPLTGPLLDLGYDPLKDIHWLETENQIDRIAAVENGTADFALVGTSLNFEVNTNPNVKICTYASDVLPSYSCCRIAAQTSWLKAHPNTARALLKAWIRAMAYYDSHHDETIAAIAKITDQEEALLRAYIDNPHFNLNIDPIKNSVVRAWNYLIALGIFEKEVSQIDINDHINTELYKQALDACQEQYGDENPSFYEEMQTQYARFNL